MANYIESHAGLLNGRLFGIDPRKSARKDDDQLTLFDADALANEGRERASDKFSADVNTATRDHKGEPLSPKRHDHATRMNMQTVSASLHRSHLPEELITSLEGPVTAVPRSDRNIGTGGAYSRSFGTIDIVARPDQTLVGGHHNSYVLLHELGHRADFRAADAEKPVQRSVPEHVDLRNVEAVHLNDPFAPHPRVEGFADGFADRHSEYGKTPSGYEDFWKSPRDNAIYTATRAHTVNTGERVTGNSAGEYMYRMLATSPHAREALAGTKGNEQVKVALNSAKDYADTRALSIQHPLPLKDSKGHQIGRTIVTRDIPEHVSGGLSHDQFLRAMRHWSASGLDQSKFDSK